MTDVTHGLDRRTFLTGALAVGAVALLQPSWLSPILRLPISLLRRIAYAHAS